MIDTVHEWFTRLTDGKLIVAGGSFAGWRWFIGDMSPLAACVALATLVLTVLKIYEFFRRRKDMRQFKATFEAAERANNHALRQQVVDVQQRIHSEPGEFR